MTNSQKAGRSIGELIAQLETRILSWIMLTVTLSPQRFEKWLAEHQFRRTEGRRQVVDYAGFARWIRNSFAYLFMWAFSFELYAIVLGHTNDNRLAFEWSLAFGFLAFYGTWVVLIAQTIGRINKGSATLIAILASLTVGGVLLLSPVYQYFSHGTLPFIEPDKVHELVAAGIPRYWAILGFVFTTIVLIPFLWMARLGPALLSLCFSKTSEAAKEAIQKMIALVSSDENKSKEATVQLTQQSESQTTFLLLVWSGLALLTSTLLFSPTVWGLFGGVVIGMVSIIVFWLRESNRFIGYFLTKTLYGVATGGLIFICTLYGASLATLMMAQAWVASKPLFALLSVCLLVGIVSAILATFHSTTEREQEELANGKAHIHSYSRTATGLDENGKPVLGLYAKKPINWSRFKLSSKYVWIGLAIAGWFVWTQVLGHAGPLDAFLAMSFNRAMLLCIALGIGLMVFNKLSKNSK